MFHRSSFVGLLVIASLSLTPCLIGQGLAFKAQEHGSTSAASAELTLGSIGTFKLNAEGVAPGQWVVAVPTISVVVGPGSNGTQEELYRLTEFLTWLRTRHTTGSELATALAALVHADSLNTLTNLSPTQTWGVDPQAMAATIEYASGSATAVRECGQTLLLGQSGQNLNWQVDGYSSWNNPAVSGFELWWQDTRQEPDPIEPLLYNDFDINAYELARKVLLYELQRYFAQDSTIEFADAIMAQVVSLGFLMEISLTPVHIFDASALNAPSATISPTTTPGLPSISGPMTAPLDRPRIVVGEPATITFIPRPPLEGPLYGPFIPSVIDWPDPIPSVYPFFCDAPIYIYLPMSGSDTSPITAHFADFVTGASGTAPVYQVTPTVGQVLFPISIGSGFAHFIKASGLPVTPSSNSFTLPGVGTGILIKGLGFCPQ